ncbi:MAG: hypothetical protein AAGB14_01745 [Verrucomicrobiota bacterium]
MKKSTDRRIFRGFCWFILTFIAVSSVGSIFITKHISHERRMDAVENRIRFAESQLRRADDENERAVAQAQLEAALIERDRLNK